VRLRATILVKLLVALVLPAAALFALFAAVAYEVSRHDLDDALGKRLTGIAASAATTMHGKYLERFGPGNENDRSYLNVVDKLTAIAGATGVHLFVMNRDFDSRGDTTPHTAIGTHYFHAELDRSELDRVFAHGDLAASVSFVGNDGVQYKTGYAPIRACADCGSDTDPRIDLAIAAEAPASYFDRLDDLRARLLAWGAGLAGVSIVAAVIATLLITRNLRKLAAAAARIGAGDLRAPVAVGSRDELGVLAEAMDRMRQQLAERDARTQQMLAGIAHEVRNPLAGMTLFAGILREEIDAGDERRGHVDRIQRELGYLERVVNDFLDYARRPKPELDDVPVADLLAEVAQLVDGQIEVDVPPKELVARADRSQVRRALINLARNAVQAAAGKRVKLSARAASGELHLAVWNEGPTIPPETLAKLFEPFFTTREKGTGLGLAFVHEIAVDHGGRVDVASAAGETTFTLVLPGESPTRRAG
jgi:signal transduction histidine kinase